MPIFGRKRQPSVPEWALPLCPADFAVFRDQLDGVLSPYGYALGDGFVTVPGRSSQYGLTNLLQQWSLAEPPVRAGLVEGHFHRLFQAEDSQPPSGAELIALIRPRLWGSETLSSVTFPLISRPVAPDLQEVLSVDLPTSVINLKPEQAEATGRSTSELWDIAHQQIDDGLPVGQDRMGNGLQVFFGDGMFVASRLLELERFVGALPAAGALVAVPHRHVLVLHPIENLEAVGALNMLAQVADGLYREGPGSIVPHVFWWRQDRPPLRIPATVYENAVNIAPPDEFVELLNGLSP